MIQQPPGHSTGVTMVAIGIARVHKTHSAPVNALDFTKDGEHLLSSGDDNRICLYSTTQGVIERMAKCDAHGTTLARFTHDPFSVIVASPIDHAVRYLSLHDNRYLRAFRAHTAAVVALEMSPKEDILASASMDDTARLWDLRTVNCQGVLRFEGRGHRPAVAFDPQGLVFAAAVSGGIIKLFDVRATDKGPFEEFSTADLGRECSFSSIKFSNDGTLMLLATTHGVHALFDAFSGKLVRTFAGHAVGAEGAQQPLEACFSPDSAYVLAGAEDGAIWRWETANGNQPPAGPLRSHLAPVTAIKCNPTRMMIASADTALCLWLPDLNQQMQASAASGQG